MTQTIIYPHQLESADARAAIDKESFEKSITTDVEKVHKYLLRLPDILKNSISNAVAENPERCKREIINIRYEALLWYNLQHIDYIPSNMLLYQLKKELKWYVDETERIYNELNEVVTKEVSQSTNDFKRSTVIDCLGEFAKNMTEADYNTLISAYVEYFNKGVFPKLEKSITVRHVAKKKFGWQLYELYKLLREDSLPAEYLLFANKNISLFMNENVDMSNIRSSNLYKYFTQKTK